MLHVEHVSHSYANKAILQSISLTLQAGQIGCLLGASGCGKTTLLRLIAGFEKVSSGVIDLNNKRLSDANSHCPVQQRHIGMVFQDYALFPHLTVTQNIGLGLIHLSKPAQTARINYLLELVNLHSVAQHYPHQLSGGQQQRVALARALAPQPTLLLMDEPFSNLDAQLREELGVEIHRLLKQENITTLMVTHDYQEGFIMADVMGVLHEGRLQQWDTPYQLYHQPNHQAVAAFVGQGALLPATVLPAQQLQTSLGVVPLPSHVHAAVGQTLTLLIRPDDVHHNDHSTQTAEIISKTFKGAMFNYELRLNDGEHLHVLVPSHHDHAVGERIGIELAMDHIVIFE
jgi:iron(III) transport system ATP-binding protein